MMHHHPVILEMLIQERRNDMLREAAVRQLVRHAQVQRPAQPSMLKRIAGALDGLLNNPERRVAEQGSFFTDKAITGEYH